MPQTTVQSFLPRGRLGELIDALRASGRRCVGPTVRDGAIVYDTIAGVGDLPEGVVVTQAPGRYVLSKTGGTRRFSWANGPQALKPLLFAPRESLWQVRRDNSGKLAFAEVLPEGEPIALFGARACDLAALALQDRHFLGGAVRDPYYARRRERLFVVAVGCSHPADTCFCASTGDGPRPDTGYDLLLEELDDGYVASASTGAGEAILSGLNLPPAGEARERAVREESERAAASQSRALPSRDLNAALARNLEHARWNDVAERCLACGNCTSVCPTCFCHAELDSPTLAGDTSEHVREWDSCFTRGHSYMHGFVVRPDTRSRYRQWFVHKFGTWHDQYGRSGCVGCGRCIAWCPVGIDPTVEAAAICGDGA